ncbi:MAG: efflux RND transporter periplasmic adaptor subunit [Rubrivivax sp.]|jgi:HlyD family secretion protein|nr:efflux RND transporter periplasmic adaptor subunit [Rubrivivax sp.]
MQRLKHPERVAPWAILVLSAALLGGCTDEPETASAPTAPSAFAASAKGRIDVEGGLVRLAAQREGVIERVLVEEGDRVVRGQLLAVVSDAPSQRSLDVARAETDQARSQLPPLSLRLGSAERELKRLQPMAGDSVSEQELDVARDQVALLQAELAAAQAAVRLSERREQVALEEIEQRRVRAPMAGTIVRRSARPGDGVSIATVTPLFLFAPDAPFIVRADVEERWLQQLRIGQAAQVELESEEGKSIPAKILRIAPVVGQRPAGDDPAERQDVRVAEVVLGLEVDSLRIGQRVIVRFPRAKAGA